MTDVLDPTTGLPELPEGQWWRVARLPKVSEMEDYGYGHYPFSGTYRYNGTPEAHATHEVQILETRGAPPAPRSWLKAKREGTLHEVIVGRLAVGKFATVKMPPEVTDAQNYTTERVDAAVAAYNKAVAKAKKIVGKGAIESREHTSGHYTTQSTHFLFFGDPAVNETTILAAAKALVKDIEDTRLAKEKAERENAEAKLRAEREHLEREARLNQFVGDYPPRVLLNDKK